MISKKRTYSKIAVEAVSLLGQYIKLARKTRKMTEHDFADRIGISRTTLQKIEKGDLKCEIGIVFEAAILAGVNLFEIDRESSSGQLFASEFEKVNDKLSLLPKSIRQKQSLKEVDDDF